MRRAAQALTLVLAALLLLPSPSRASGKPGPLIVRAGGASVIVRDNPFRLAIRRPGRRAFLSTPRSAPELGGVTYAGLGYSVGRDAELDYPELPGESLNPPPSGAPEQHRAVGIAGVSRRGRRMLVVLRTDDPAGRRIVLTLSGGPRATLDIRARVRGGPGVSAIAMAFRSRPGESFHGFGGRRESTDLRGRDFKGWVIDYRYPDASTGYYAPQNSFISSRGYGAMLDTARIARWRLASDSPRLWRVSVAGRSLRLLAAPGGPRRAIATLSAISGRHRVPPAWSLGPALSRTFGILSDGGGVYRTKVEADVARIEQGGLPVSSYAFEGWAGMPRAEVKGLVRRLRGRGVRTLLYLRSFVSNDIAGTEAPGAYETAIARGYVATDAAGDPYLVPSPFPGGLAAVIDFTDPAARRWWRKRVAGLLGTGAEGFMNDFGEQVLPGMRFDDGSSGVTMHNRYPVLQARVTRSAVSAWERRHPGRSVYFFGRAGFGGRPGSAAFENAQFPGDETVDWERSTGLPSIVPDMLNRAVGGAAGFTTDIGGYAQFTPSRPVMPPTGRELFIRWSQAAALTPFFRVHNSGLNGVRMPWDFDPEALRVWREMARLHRRAEPLILRLWQGFSRSGVPMTRPLWLADPVGARGPRGDDQWLLGGDLLVAPVLVEGARSRPVRLPPGCWRRQGRGPRLSGARTIEVTAALDQLPWFTRCGTAPLHG